MYVGRDEDWDCGRDFGIERLRLRFVLRKWRGLPLAHREGVVKTRSLTRSGFVQLATGARQEPSVVA